MPYAPIVFIAYNRYEHTKKTIEALANNALAAESDLYIFSDGPKYEHILSVQQVRDYLEKITGFKSITIINRPVNLGLTENIVQAIDFIAEKYDRFIVIEDDIATSKYFLKYMNDALELYEDNPKVMHVSGYTLPVDTKGLAETFFHQLTHVWGWATWTRAWKFYHRDIQRLEDSFSPSDKYAFNLNNSSNEWGLIEQCKKNPNFTWDVFWYAAVFQAKGLCIQPRTSLVQNIGHDSTGVHCGTTALFHHKEIATKPVQYFETQIQQNSLFLKRVIAFNRKHINYELSLRSKIKHHRRKIKAELKRFGRKLYQKTLSVYKNITLRPLKSKTRLPASKSLLIVRTDLIGDYILFRNMLPLIRESKKYKDYHITLCGNKAWKSIFDEWDSDYVNETVWIDSAQFDKDQFYRENILKKLQERTYELAIQPTFSRDYWVGERIMMAVNALFKMGYDGDNSNITDPQKKISNRCYNKLIDYHDSAHPFEFYRNKHIIETLLDEKILLESPFIETGTSSIESFQLPNKFAILFVGASNVQRQWPVECFAYIGQFLEKKHKLNLVIAGGPGDENRAEDITAWLKDVKFINIAGKTSLPQLVDIIARADIFISSDTAAAHIASLLKRPTLVLSIANNIPGRFIPYPACINPAHRVVYLKQFQEGLHPEAIKRISPYEVTDAIDELLSQNL